MKKISFLLTLAIALFSYSLSSFKAPDSNISELTPKGPTGEILNSDNYDKILVLEFAKDQLQKEIDSLSNTLFVSPDTLTGSGHNKVLFEQNRSGESLKIAENSDHKRNYNTSSGGDYSTNEPTHYSIKESIENTRDKLTTQRQKRKSYEKELFTEIGQN